MKLLITISCILLLSPACKKESLLCCALPPVEMTRTQTQCADAWGYGSTNDATIALLRTYLSQKQISTSKIELQATGDAMTCLACQCSRGFLFHVWTENRNIDSLKKEGFTIK